MTTIVNPTTVDPSRIADILAKAKSLAGLTVEEATRLIALEDPESLIRLHEAASAVKESVFPFPKFPTARHFLGPEMRSTGEVMGIDARFGTAFAKAQIAAKQYPKPDRDITRTEDER